MELPASLEDITADWLAEHMEAPVASLEIRSMDGFVGRMGEVGIAEVTYSDPDCELPSSFIAKCPLDDDLAQLMNVVMQSYQREHGFYANFADQVPMRVPTAYVNEYNPESGKAVLFMERISGTPGDIQTGCTVEQMEELLRMAARMHGEHWMSPAVGEFEWVFDWNAPTWEMGIPMVEEHWYSLTKAWPDLVSADLMAALERRWMGDVKAGLEELAERPWTFCHQDYELDNIIFTDEAPVIIDWQTVMRSFPGVDMGMLLATGQTAETIAEEGALLDAYREELAASGGPSWSRDEVLEDMCHWLTWFITGISIPVDQQRHTHEVGDRERDRLEEFIHKGIEAAARWNYTDRLG